MSGDKQHYIPQIALKAFRLNPKGKVARVHVFRSDKIYSSPTEDVAAQRFFFSESGDGETLDDVMTRHENGPFNEDFRTLSRAAAGPVEPELASRVVGHLFIRNHHLRGSMRAGASLLGSMVEQLFGSSDQIAELMGAGAGSAPTNRFREAFRSALGDDFALANLGLPEPVLMSLAYMMLRENRSSLGDASDAARSMAQTMQKESADFARNAHLKGLTQGLLPEGRIAVLRRLDWQIVEVTEHSFILPDSTALALDQSGTAGTALSFNAEELKALLMPLSPKRMLVGSMDAFEWDLSNFNRSAAPHCLEFFVSSYRDPELEALAASIGSKALATIQEALSESVRNFRANLEKPEIPPGSFGDGEWMDEATPPVSLESDALTPEAGRRLAALLHQLIIFSSQRFDVGPLRRVLVPSDYENALASLERGALSEEAPILPSNEGWSAAYNVPVEQDGEHTTVMVLHADAALMLLDESKAVFGAGVSIVLAQLARIGADVLVGTVFDGGITVGEAHDRLLLPDTLNCWKTYLVAGYQSQFSPALHEFYRQTFLERIGALQVSLARQRQRYRVHGDVDQLLRATLSDAVRVLSAASAVAGSLNNMTDEDDGLTEQLDAAGWLNWFDLLRTDLADIWMEGTRYPEQQSFLVLNRHVERLLACGAIFLWDDATNARVEVPLWSDWTWLHQQQN